MYPEEPPRDFRMAGLTKLKLMVVIFDFVPLEFWSLVISRRLPYEGFFPQLLSAINNCKT